MATTKIDSRIGSSDVRAIAARINDIGFADPDEVIERVNEAIAAWCKRDPDGTSTFEAALLDCEIDEIIGNEATS